MIKYDSAKIIRLFIAGLIFLTVAAINGMETREVQQALLTIAVVAVFSVLLKNIWLTLFMWWVCFLFIYFRFQGLTYFFNIFIGCLLYFLTKISYKKQHIGHFIKVLIIFTCCNVAYMVLQFFDLDFYYYLHVVTPIGEEFTHSSFRYLCGFMGNQANMSVLAALTIPLVATRRPKWAVWASLLLFVPICAGKTSSALVAGFAGLMLVLFYRLNRRVWFGIIAVGILLASLYVVKVDLPMGMMGTRPKMWKVVMRDAVKRPVTGYGLDSFRNFTATQRKQYCEAINKTSVGWHLTTWDNPHNLLITLAFEFGLLITWVLLGGYLRDYFIAYRRAIKTPNTLATTGFLLVFFLVSLAQFPICLAALAVFIIPMFALAEKSVGLYE